MLQCRWYRLHVHMMILQLINIFLKTSSLKHHILFSLLSHFLFLVWYVSNTSLHSNLQGKRSYPQNSRQHRLENQAD